MTQIVGKYKIYKTEKYFKIRYRYSLSDFIGGLWYLLSMIVGGFLAFIAIYKFSVDDITNWLMLLTGSGLAIYSLVMIVMSLYNPLNGILQIRYDDNKVIIRDFPKNETIDIDSISGFYYEIIRVYKPKQRYAMIYLKTVDNEKIDCFIVRSSSFLDKTHEVERELNKLSRTLCNILSSELY